MGFMEKQGVCTGCTGRDGNTLQWSRLQPGPAEIQELKAEIYVLKKSIAHLQEKVAILECARRP